MNGVPVNVYQSEWNKKRHAAEQAHRVVRVRDVPNALQKEIRMMRDSDRLSWHAIALRVGLSSYLVKKCYEKGDV